MIIQLYERIYSFFDPIDKITVCPDEIIIEIFKKFDLSTLCRASLVCKKFDKIQNMPNFWEIQARYFKIKFKINIPRTYKNQLRIVELTHGRLDLFTKKVEIHKYLTEEEAQDLCKEIAFFMPPNYSVSIYSDNADKKFTSRIDCNRAIFSKTILGDPYALTNPMQRRSFF